MPRATWAAAPDPGTRARAIRSRHPTTTKETVCPCTWTYTTSPTASRWTTSPRHTRPTCRSRGNTTSATCGTGSTRSRAGSSASSTRPRRKRPRPCTARRTGWWPTRSSRSRKVAERIPGGRSPYGPGRTWPVRVDTRGLGAGDRVITRWIPVVPVVQTADMFRAALPENRAARRILLGTLFSAIGRGLTLPFLFVYLNQVRGLHPGTVGLLVGWMGLVGLALAPVGGTLVDRYGARRVVLPLFAVEALGTASLGFVHSVASAFVALTVVAVGTAAVFSGQNTILASLVPDAQRQHVFGLWFTLLNLGIGIGGMLSAAGRDPAPPGDLPADYFPPAATHPVPAPHPPNLPHPGRPPGAPPP